LRLSHVGVIRIRRQDGCLLTVAARVTRVVEHVNKLGDAFSRSARVRESRIYRAHMPPSIKNHAINHAIERSWPRVITLCHEIILPENFANVHGLLETEYRMAYYIIMAFI